MSQVRKFSGGGNTAESTEKKSRHDNKYGHYIVDGKTYDVNDDFINNYITSAKQFNDAGTSRIASHVIEALKSGQDVSFDTLNNRVTGINQYLNADDVDRSNAYYSGPQNKKMKRQYQRKEINKNTDLHQTNIGIKNLGSIRFTNPEEKAITQNLINLYGDPRSWDYNRNSDGTISFSTGPQNAGNLAAIDRFFDFLGMSNEDADKKYSYTGNENYIGELRDWYKSNQNYDKEGLLSRIKSSNINDNDWDLLTRMGFVRNENSNNSSSSTTNPRSYEGSGFNNDTLEQAGYYVVKGEDGNTYLYDNSGNLVQDKLYLKGTPWANGSLFENGAVYKGRFYTNDQIMNQSSEASQDIRRNLFDAMKNAQDPESVRQAALNSTWRIYGMDDSFNINEDNTFVYGQNYLKGFTDLFNNGTYYWSDITSNYNLPEGFRLLSFYNKYGRDADNSLTEQFAISDGENSQIFKNIQELQNYLNKNNIQTSQTYRSVDPLSQYKYIMNNGKRYFYMPTQYLISNDPSTAYNIYRDEQGQYYTDGNNGKMKLLQGKAIMDKIKNGTVSAQELKNGFAQEDNRSGWGADGRMFGINMGTKNKIPYDLRAYDDYFGFYKDGGKIQKKQWGGQFHTGQVGKQKESEPVKSNVGQPQKLNADKKLETGTDTANVAAGVLDAAGLATSWIPGVGTAIGFLGSLARLSADIQKDGFQWEDLGNFGINVGLDALTILPGVGAIGKATKTGVKAAKAANSASKAGKILKATSKAIQRSKPILATAGTAAGATQIAGAVKDAQEGNFTSESMGNLLSGLGNTAAGITGLSGVYKQAKIAKKLDSVPTKDKYDITDNDGRIKKVAKKVGNWVNKQANDTKGSFRTVSYMYRPGKVESVISNNWQTLARSFNKYANRLAAEYLNKTKPKKVGNVEYSGQRIGPNWMYDRFKLNKKHINTSAAIPSVSPASPTPATPTPNFVRNGFFRAVPDVPTAIPATPSRISSRSAQDQNLRDLTAELLKKIRKVNTSEGTKKLVMDVGFRGNGFNGSRLPNRYDDVLAARPDLRDMIIKHIDADRYYHGSGIDDYIRNFNLMFKKGGKILKAQPGNKMPYGTFVTDNDSNDPNLYNYSKSGIQFNGSNVDWTKTYGQGKFNDLRNYYLNNWDNEAFKPIRDNYLSQLSKGNNNVDLSKFTKDDFARLTQDQKLGYAHNLWTDQLRDHLYNTGDIFKISGFNINNNKDLSVPFLNSDGTPMTTEQTTEYLRSKGAPEEQINEYISRNTNDSLDGGTIEASVVTASKPNNGSAGNSPDGLTKKPFNFNVNPDDLIGFGQMLGNIVANNKMYNRLEKGIKSARGTMEAMPTEIYDRYQDHITPIYQEAAKQKRQFFVPTSTDAVTNYALRQANEDTAQQLLIEGKLKASEAYSQYLDKDLAARRTYADERRRVGQSNRERMANISMQLAQNDAARRMSNWQSINNGILEFRNKLAQDRQRKLNFMRQEDAIMAQRKYDEYVNKKMAEGDYYNQFNALDADKKKQYSNALDWLSQTNLDAYNEIMNGANVEALNYNRVNIPKYFDYFKIDTTPLSTVTSSSTVSMPAYVTINKKGGKTSTYTKRHTGPKPDEAIWVQRNKDTAKALEKLHDAVIKLFMKTIS